MAGQKLKSHSGAAKRFKRTSSGKFLRRKAGVRHILTTKNAKRKMRLGKSAVVAKSDQKALARLLPYS
ncbi:MAG: 50S ribosomal protein L35 [Nitrospirae bacterium]|nr:50S ribosomal protein L35 [Nitrospirota bacterium]MDA1305011.1 50S ribosomal protein L35 [Nitrospirota bacterium]